MPSEKTSAPVVVSLSDFAQISPTVGANVVERPSGFSSDSRLASMRSNVSANEYSSSSKSSSSFASAPRRPSSSDRTQSSRLSLPGPSLIFMLPEVSIITSSLERRTLRLTNLSVGSK